MRANLFHKSVVLIAAFMAGILVSSGPANSTEKMLYSFKAGDDGAGPFGGVVEDNAGNLYGTTSYGGNSCDQYGGCGTVFKLATDGTESVLHAFHGGSDGEFPNPSLIRDGAGNLYGTTIAGGMANPNCSAFNGCGTVFKLAPDGTETVLYAFKGSTDGFWPFAGLLMDKQGNLYGTTSDGPCDPGSGTIFKLSPDGSETVLYTFQGGDDGCDPSSSLVMDNSNNLYGTTIGGGTAPCGCGTVFELSSTGKETILHSFQAGSDGSGPYSGLIRDKAGDLFGITNSGGGTCTIQSGCGAVFEVSSNGVESILHSFQGGSDGAFPYGGVVLDKAGNIYGTTAEGGSNRCDSHLGCGTVFQISSGNAETVLHDFKVRRGIYPYSSLIIGKNDELYGTASEGGLYGAGVVFRVRE